MLAESPATSRRPRATARVVTVFDAPITATGRSASTTLRTSSRVRRSPRTPCQVNRNGR